MNKSSPKKNAMTRSSLISPFGNNRTDFYAYDRLYMLVVLLLLSSLLLLLCAMSRAE